jgi:transposase
MRGADERTGSLFSYVNIETRAGKDHPLRRIRALVNTALAELDKDFAGLYAPLGRPSIAPEKLIRAMLLQMLYPVRAGLDGAAGLRSSVSLVCGLWRR